MWGMKQQRKCFRVSTTNCRQLKCCNQNKLYKNKQNRINITKFKYLAVTWSSTYKVNQFHIKRGRA